MKECSNVLHNDCIEEVGRCYVCDGEKTDLEPTSCPKCDFEWGEKMVDDDGEEFVPNHYCSDKATLDDGEDSWVEDGEVNVHSSELKTKNCQICKDRGKNESKMSNV